MPARTPITIPAMAPPLRPLLTVTAPEPVRAAPPVPTAVSKGIVVVNVPVETTVAMVWLVGRMNADAVPELIGFVLCTPPELEPP